MTFNHNHTLLSCNALRWCNNCRQERKPQPHPITLLPSKTRYLQSMNIHDCQYTRSPQAKAIQTLLGYRFCPSTTRCLLHKYTRNPIMNRITIVHDPTAMYSQMLYSVSGSNEIGMYFLTVGRSGMLKLETGVNLGKKISNFGPKTSKILFLGKRYSCLKIDLIIRFLFGRK